MVGCRRLPSEVSYCTLWTRGCAMVCLADPRRQQPGVASCQCGALLNCMTAVSALRRSERIFLFRRNSAHASDSLSFTAPAHKPKFGDVSSVRGTRHRARCRSIPSSHNTATRSGACEPPRERRPVAARGTQRGEHGSTSLAWKRPSNLFPLCRPVPGAFFVSPSTRPWREAPSNRAERCPRPARAR